MLFVIGIFTINFNLTINFFNLKAKWFLIGNRNLQLNLYFF